MKRIRSLDYFQPILSEEEKIAQEPIQFSSMTYEDFLKKFKERFKADRAGYELVKNKFQVKKAPKAKYVPPNTTKQKLAPSDALSEKAIAEFKAQILENVKNGVDTKENIYKEHRQRIENAKI